MTSPSSAVPASRLVTVLDEGWSTTREAEHGALAWAADRATQLVLVCTHFVAGRVVVTAQTDVGPDVGPDVAPDGALAAVHGQHLARTAGRVFVFPGQDALPATTTVAGLIASTAVDDVLGVGGVRPDGDVRLDTQGFVRPELSGGRMVLRVRPAACGVVPFEQPHPTPCCADHA